jgi:hypothetical protein
MLGAIMNLSLTQLIFYGGVMDAKLSFLKSSAANVTGYRIKFGNAETALTQFQDFDLVTGVTWTGAIGNVIVTGLDPALPWYFQAFAINAIGVESTGTNLVNTVAAPSPPSSLSLVALTV